MRLKYLWIENYKNLKNLHIDFDKGDGLTILMGTNGSGKSNIIEALSFIFSDAYKERRKNPFGDNCDFICCYDNGDSCIYLIGDGARYIAIKAFVNTGMTDEGSACLIPENNEFKGLIRNIFRNISSVVDATSDLRISFSKATKDDLPHNIIAIYSGEETRLWDNAYTQPYKSYIKNMRTGASDNVLHMTYLNKHHWEIALFILWFSNLPNNQKYVQEYLNINHIETVYFKINKSVLVDFNHPLLDVLISRLSQSDDSEFTLSAEEVHKRLSDDTVLMVDQMPELKMGAVIKGEIRHTLYSNERELFYLLIQACLPKGKKVIENIKITFNNGLTTSDLSEGEKKILLIKCALEIAADEKSIVLLDEPDAHVHETRKEDIFNLLSEYTKYGRQILITSHSPTIANLCQPEVKVMLEKDDNGFTKVLDMDNVSIVEKLTDGLWTSTEKTIFFTSTKPLVLVEGIGDINYIKKAIKILSDTNDDYKQIDCDFLQMGGAGESANQFIGTLFHFISARKKVIVIMDRDKSGSQGMKSCLGKGNDRVHDIGTYKKENWYYFMLPKTEEHKETDFVIEDYFSLKHNEKFVNEIVKNAGYHFNKITKDLKEQVKAKLKENVDSNTADELKGFEVLLDKIVRIITDTEECEII